MSNTRSKLLGTSQYLGVEQSRVIIKAKQNLVHLEHTVTMADPARNLKLGYSLSYAGGKLLRSLHDVEVGALIETTMADGGFTSEVKQVL